ncbi:autoinducer binding domain-containing protein [Parachitinimonas caeni]|uniref:Autoinducer binding domain-containing protein n=1 Tax=Parachitinimonas caeni TaxID=3031301 RepID=A0ABT7DVP1_9NEIS|nr:autoinducer binding domain-containing protein [Parachitinimonas caeni]MDK2124130.1 autoinducer binding domain-containing protein [Parachitinimonas caeni]
MSDLADTVFLLRTADDIRAVTLRAARNLGFDTYAVGYDHRPAKVAETILHNFSKSWDGSGNAELQTRDPVHQKQLRQVAPIVWGRDIYEKTGTQDIWEYYASLGMQSGLDVPLSQKNGVRMVVSVYRDGPLPPLDECIDRLAALHTFAHAIAASILPIANAEQFTERLTFADHSLLCRVLEGWPLKQLLHPRSLTLDSLRRQIRHLCSLAGVNHINGAAALYARAFA